MIGHESEFITGDGEDWLPGEEEAFECEYADDNHDYLYLN